jgi:hypothetical protein
MTGPCVPETNQPTDSTGEQMTIYQPGQRVALVHTNDPATRLGAGATGTVRRHDPRSDIVDVDWDSGARKPMRLNALS